MAAVEVPQTFEYRGGQLNAAPVLEVENVGGHLLENSRSGSLLPHYWVLNLNVSVSSVLGFFGFGLSGSARSPKKWLSFCQSLRNTNHLKDSVLASLFGKLKYEENLIDSIYETEKHKSLVSATPLSTAFFFSFIVQDFQDSLDDENDTRSSQEYLNDLEEEYQARAFLAKSKRFFNKDT
ncbi:hypothetical protein Tco_0543328 [Tanacetum coccineum]